MKKIIITGGAGFIGSHVVEFAIENNNQVIVIDNLVSGKLSNLPDDKRVVFYQADILKDNIEYIFESENPDYCIHLAAQTSVNYSEADPIYDAQMNILSSINLLNLCRKYKIKKFITASSAAVYGIPEKLPIDENSQTKPISFYGISKLTMEKYIQHFEIPYIIFRFSNVSGPRQSSSKESGVIAIFHEAMLNSKQIEIFGDGKQIRDFVFVKDVAAIINKVINTDISNITCNISSNTGITINQLFKLMKEMYNYKYDPIYLSPRVGDIKNSILDNAQIIKNFPDLKFTDINKGLNVLFEYDKNSKIGIL